MTTKLSNGAVTFLDILGWKGIWQKRADSIDVLWNIIDLAKNHIEDDWVGVIQAPSAYFTSINPCGEEFKMVEYDVPLKTKGTIYTRCVDWTKEWNDKGKNELDLRDAFVDFGPIFPEIYSKYRNTLDFYRRCQKLI